MPDQVMECPRCRGAAALFAGSDEGVHYLCPNCGCSFIFGVKTLKIRIEESDHQSEQR
jgi:predicted RNA-binding Zn-ribbon protein involved in translation (DUF1610 family)